MIAQEVWMEKEDEPRNHGASNLTLLAGTPDENSQKRMGWDQEIFLNGVGGHTHT